MKTKQRYCASCRDGEKTVSADIKVKGKIWSQSSDRMTPYQAYLCLDHYYQLNDDGADLNVVEILTEEARKIFNSQA